MATVPTKKQDPGLLQRDAVLAAEFRAIYGEAAPCDVPQGDPKPDAKADPKPDTKADTKPDAKADTKPDPQADPPQDFLPPPDEVTAREAALRNAFFDQGTTALCLSGGGIRSASFCLGVAQGLARLGLLTRFHYLSTVSGGGYLGCLLAAWAYRTPGGMDDVQTALKDDAPGSGTPVAWWREYLSYLAPRRGLLSLDTWTLIATYLRNLLLNALVWLPLIAIVLLLPHLLASIVDGVPVWLGATPNFDLIASGTLLFGVTSMALGTVLLRSMVGRGDPAPGAPQIGAKLPRQLQQPFQLAIVLLSSGEIMQMLLLTGAVSLACGAWWIGISEATTFWQSLVTHDLSFLPDWLHLNEKTGRPLLFALLYSFSSGFAASLYTPPAIVARRVWLASVAIGLGCGLLTGLLIGIIVTWFVPTGPWALPLPLAMTVIAPALVAALGLGEILFVGLTSKWTSDFDREWWARAGAWASMFTVGWLALFAMAFYGPELLRLLPRLQDGQWPYWLTVILASGGVARIILVTGRTAPTETQPRPVPRKRDQALDLVTFVLLFALLAGIADLVATALDAIAAATSDRGWQVPRGSLPYAASDVLILLAFLGVVLGIASSRININRFSLHAMYRDRLIRAFLGATRGKRDKPTAWALDEKNYEEKQFEARKADPFIQFDRDDNPIFRWLARERIAGQFDARNRPFLLVNAALNLVSGANLAWQERKATSFTFSALHAGSAALGLGYRSSSDYAADVGGLTLGTAMAVSGAAVSPNAGAFSSPVRTFLLTLFNARLGWWLGHPGDARASALSGPRLAIMPMLREMFGRTNDRPPWIFVSDGGHFDNLGLYEAIRRGCRNIVVVDAGCDPYRNFDDLGNAIRKIRIDFGVTIQRSGPWRLGGRDLQEKGRYCALFEVLYKGSPSRKGRLLYIKPSLYPKAPGLPIDVLQYAGRSETFPHEPTADQFFAESQFESYRALGEFEVAEIAGTEKPVESVAEFIDLASFRLLE